MKLAEIPSQKQQVTTIHFNPRKRSDTFPKIF